MESEERDLGVPNYIPMYNSEEKVDEINRLLEILSKRKRYSIVVAMLLVFQKFNYQKLLKDFLIQGVKDYIAANPFKVVSYNGVPFTVKNCFMGMRVIIGKHRIFQKEMIEGCEYLNVNLVYTCIFLSDEIAKICKGSRNSRPIHSSLLDELEIEEKDLKNLLNKKRTNSNTNESNDLFNDEMSNMLDKKQPGEQNKKIDNFSENNSIGVKKKNNIISLGDSDSEGGRKRKLGVNINLPNSNQNNSEQNQKIKPNIMSNKTVFFPKDTGYLKCPLQDYLTVWNFGKNSPVNLYLKDNIQNIFKIRNIFTLMKEVGQKGQNYIQNLSKYIPTNTPGSTINKDESSEKITENLEKINNIYKKYNLKKKKLIQIYQRLKSTVENMKLGGYNPDKNIIEDDSEYLNMIGKKYDELLKEIYPLFNEIYIYDKECPIKSISTNLFSLSKTLKENELIFRLFTLFSQKLVNLFPLEANNINTLSDLLMSDKLSEKEKEEKFYEIALKEKDNLLKSAEPIKKMAYDNSIINNGEYTEKIMNDINVSENNTNEIDDKNKKEVTVNENG